MNDLNIYKMYLKLKATFLLTAKVTVKVLWIKVFHLLSEILV